MNLASVGGEDTLVTVMVNCAYIQPCEHLLLLKDRSSGIIEISTRRAACGYAGWKRRNANLHRATCGRRCGVEYKTTRTRDLELVAVAYCG